MTKSIVVFDQDLRATSFVGSDLKIETIEGGQATLSEALEEIGFTPSMRIESETESGNSVGLEVISREEPRFLEAVVSNLRQRSFIAAVVPEHFKKLLVNLNQKNISPEDREAVVSRLVNMQDIEAKELLNDIEKLELVLK